MAALGDWQGAATQFAQALELAPAMAKAQAGLARSLAALGRHEEANTAFDRALAHTPDDATLHNDAGATLARLGRGEDAADRFRAACRLRPGFAAAHSNLGNALMAAGEAEAAVASFRAAIAADPAMAEAHGNLGVALLALLHPEDALPHLDRALSLEPSLAEMLNARGQVLVMLGDLDAARDSFAKASALRPDKPEFYRGVLATQRLAPGDARLAALTSLSRDVDALDKPERIALHFALHRAFEDQENYEEAFAHLVQGNALRRTALSYDEAAALALMDDIKSVFGAAMMQRRPACGDAPDVPIFILGMPRSGSTLVEQILSSHPQVFGGGERLFMTDAATGLGGNAAPRLAYPANAAACEALEFLTMGERYRTRLQALAPGMPRVTDKMPANFHHVGLIRMMLPNARIIHTRRDPMDTCLSCFVQTFGRGLPFTYDLGELGRYTRAYAGLMAHWRNTIPEPFMLEVDYEDMVADTEGQIRRILAYCGLEWDPACLAFHTNPRTVITASATQVRRPIYGHSAGRAARYGRLLDPLRDALS